MSAFTESTHAGEFILSKANGNRSFDTIIVASGEGKLAAGTVLAKSGDKHVQYDPDVSGAPASAILFDAVDATNADQKANAVTRDAEVNGHSLVWDSEITEGELADGITELAEVGIIVR